MEGPGPCVLAQNKVPWEAEAGVFRLKIECHGRPKPACLGSICS